MSAQILRSCPLAAAPSRGRCAIDAPSRASASPRACAHQRPAPLARSCSKERSSSTDPQPQLVWDRRVLLSAAIGAAAIVPSLPSVADEALPELTLFQGTASPPTSYGGYGGNASESFKYQFLVPADWKPQVINKVEKGTQGIDCKFTNPKIRGMKAFVISLGRAGEDSKSFKISDAESTLSGFAGADYAIQDALSTADSIDTVKEERDDQTYYKYKINSPVVHYTASISTRRGKIFALFVACPGKEYGSQAALVDTMLDSFSTL